MIDSIGSDNPVENALLIGFLKLLNSIGIEKWQAHHTDDALCPEAHQFTHRYDQRPSGSKHIVSHEDCLATDITEEVDALDIGVLGILADDGVVTLL